MPFSPLRPDPGPNPAILHVYGSVRLSALHPSFGTKIPGRQDLALSAWLDLPNIFTYAWRSEAPEHAGLIELAIFQQEEACQADPRALLALMVHKAALFTPELRNQILLLLP